MVVAALLPSSPSLFMRSFSLDVNKHKIDDAVTTQTRNLTERKTIIKLCNINKVDEEVISK